MVRQAQQRSEQLKRELMPYAQQAQNQGREMVLPGGNSPAAREMGQVKTVVFISKGMPEPALLALLKQGAGRNDTVFAMRGWGDGSIRTMYDYTASLVKKLPPALQKTPPQIIVHPKSFRAYRITHVPAVAHRDTDGKWYLIQGAQSLEYTIRQIRERQFKTRLSQQWRVTEPDQAEIMRRQVQQHDWQAEARKAADAAAAGLNGHLSLPPHRENAKFTFTPFIAAGHDIRDPRSGKTVYPKGTRFNVLALDPKGTRKLVVIDGTDRWQVEFVRHLLKNHPAMVVLYTRHGLLAGSGIRAAPLDETVRKNLNITGVPTFFSQNGLHFDVFNIKPR